MTTALRTLSETAAAPAVEARRVEVKLSLYGAEAARLPAVPGLGCLELSGTGLISSECGTSAFTMAGTVRCHRSSAGLTLRTATFTGTRLSGYDAGPVELTLSSPEIVRPAGSFEVETTLFLSDANNAALPVRAVLRGLVADGALRELTVEGGGAGFCFAEFLADGECLDEEE
ncbi:hypothetical protein [Azospirillum sp. TSO22-1]|uniref:hypothetical protein n=1 Tax=Azospirillum sp. TSO22-1 TaxID=716789 RepID=UPI000D614BFB|nr:hypothetical protein [Azospirillum sp. TSO22-1]PWC56072.1 hypothetical protein TSO221_03260 [Azospirillum sp. TSO22-1]